MKKETRVKFEDLIVKDEEVEESDNEYHDAIIEQRKKSKPSIKDRLKGTCVLNEKEGMGAEIVALYTEAGFENPDELEGSDVGSYYGESDGIIHCRECKFFKSVLTLDQLREIVRGEKQLNWSNAEIREFKIPVSCVLKGANIQPKYTGVKHSVEFKEGEMVEYTSRTFDEFINDGSTFTGGKTKTGHYILQRISGELFSVMHVRKIDPDKELKELAKPILEKWDLLKDGKVDADVFCAMIEMAKKVKK